MSKVITKENHTRFKDAVWYDPNKSIVLGGLGGIGSWTSLLLSRLGYTIYGYDFDNYDTTNMGGQFVSKDSIGVNKAEVAKKFALDFSNNDKFFPLGMYNKEESMVDNITISAFDNMKARKDMFESWKEMQLSKTERDPSEINIFIDGRLLMEGFQIYAVTSKNRIIEYEKTLFEDSKVQDLPCTLKSTSHSGAMIASFIVGVLTNHIYNKKVGSIIRDVPFMTTFDIPLMLLETK